MMDMKVFKITQSDSTAFKFQTACYFLYVFHVFVVQLYLIIVDFLNAIFNKTMQLKLIDIKIKNMNAVMNNHLKITYQEIKKVPL